MSFSDIRLPDAVIGELYKTSLVKIIAQNSTPLRYLGKNLQRLLVLVNYADEVYLPAVQLEFLEKILLACKLNLGDIAILNLAKQTGKFEDYIKELSPKAILIFGTSVPGYQDNGEMAFFEPASYNGIIVMTAPALEKLDDESKELKTRFWHSLKQFLKL